MNPFSHLKISRARMLASAVVLLVLFVVAGCTMVPKYQQPSVPLAKTWPSVPGYAKTKTAQTNFQVADIGWRDFFLDPRLQQVIELSLTNNPNLYVAVQNVVETKALYRVQQAQLIPTVNLNANGTRTRTPNVYTSGTNAAPPLQYTEYNVNLGVASYELDLFGRVRSLNQQSLETYLATQEANKSVHIALVAQVAEAYLTEEEAIQQLAIARDQLKAARQAFDLTQKSFEAGVSSQFDLNNASIQLQNASASVAGYAQQLAEASDNLDLLAGMPLPQELKPQKPFNTKVSLADIPSGLPSDLLQRRPDVIEAEHQLKAANANIGAARAAFFPTVTLTGQAGMASTTLQSLFAPGSHAWGFSPQIVWPIFDMGTAYHELQAVKAEQRMKIADYQSTVQNAFKEVADALAVRTTVQSQLTDTEALVKSNQQSFRLTQASFKAGVDSQLDVLEIQNALDSAKLSLIQAQYSRLNSLINLYQALGGGWQEHTTNQTAQATAQASR
jgi:outer membrane protein, multidrug efflux system